MDQHKIFLDDKLSFVHQRFRRIYLYLVQQDIPDKLILSEIDSLKVVIDRPVNNPIELIDQLIHFIDHANKLISHFLFVTYIDKNETNEKIFNVPYIEHKLDLIKEIIIGSNQPEINTHEFIHDMLGVKYSKYDGKNVSCTNCYPWAVTDDPNISPTFEHIWKTNENTYYNFHIANILQNDHSCSFMIKTHADDLTYVGYVVWIMEFLKLFDSEFDKYKYLYALYLINYDVLNQKILNVLPYYDISVLF